MVLAGYVVIGLLNIYSGLIFIWVLGNLIPQWRYQSWFHLVEELVQPCMNLFRGLKLQMGMLDLTPAAAMTCLWLFTEALKASIGRI